MAKGIRLLDKITFSVNTGKNSCKLELLNDISPSVYLWNAIDTFTFVLSNAPIINKTTLVVLYPS